MQQPAGRWWWWWRPSCPLILILERFNPWVAQQWIINMASPPQRALLLLGRTDMYTYKHVFKAHCVSKGLSGLNSTSTGGKPWVCCFIIYFIFLVSGTKEKTGWHRERITKEWIERRIYRPLRRLTPDESSESGLLRWRQRDIRRFWGLSEYIYWVM